MGMLIRAGGHHIRFGTLRLLAIGISVLLFFALSNTNALGSHPMLLKETFSLLCGLHTHPDGCLHSCLLIGCNNILF